MTRKSLKNRPQQTGLSLLEVLVALLILSVVLLGFLSVQSSATRTSVQAQQKTAAIFLLTAQTQATRDFSYAQKQHYVDSLQAISASISVDDNPMIQYKNAAQARQVDCVRAACSPLSLAQTQAVLAARDAAAQRLILQAKLCTKEALCLQVAWGHQAMQALKQCQASDSCVELEVY